MAVTAYILWENDLIGQAQKNLQGTLRSDFDQ